MLLLNRKTPKNVPLYEITFDSLHELVESKASGSWNENDHCGTPSHWWGTSSVFEFKSRMEAGWPELATTMLGMVAQLPKVDIILSQNIRNRRKRARGDFGNELDIHAVYQGRCDRAWDKTERVPKWSKQHKLVHLFVNVAASARVSSTEMLWRAAACYRLYEALTANGHSVAITIGRIVTGLFRDGHHDETTVMSVPVKAYGESVPDAKLAVMLNGGFYRHYFIAKGSYMTPRAGSVSRSQGSPAYVEVLPMHLQQEKDDGAAIIQVGRIFNRLEAEAFVNATLAKFSKEAA